jgi:hypothetical protein
MFANNPGAYPSKVSTSVHIHYIIPGMKDMPGSNVVTYFATSSVTKKKVLIKTRGQCYNTFTTISYDFSQYARAFIPGKPFQPSLMGRAHSGRPVKIILGRRSLPGTHALAYKNS